MQEQRFEKWFKQCDAHLLIEFISISYTIAAEPEPEPPKSVIKPKIEPAPRGFRPKSKRVADDTTSKDGLTVATSVSYRVSAKTGRRRRDVTTESKSFLHIFAQGRSSVIRRYKNSLTIECLVIRIAHVVVYIYVYIVKWK